MRIDHPIAPNLADRVKGALTGLACAALLAVGLTVAITTPDEPTPGAAVVLRTAVEPIAPEPAPGTVVDVPGGLWLLTVDGWMGCRDWAFGVECHPTGPVVPAGHPSLRGLAAPWPR